MGLLKHVLISNFIMLLIPLIALNLPLFSNQIEVYYFQMNLLQRDGIMRGDEQNNYSLVVQERMPLMSRFILSHCQFDGLQFLSNRYEYQPNFAFIKGYVTLIRTIQTIVGQNNMGQQSTNIVGSFQITILIVILINKILFSLSSFKLKNIAFRLTQDRNKAQLVALLFVYNPACIFFHGVYTEAIYAFITFTAIQYALGNKTLPARKDQQLGNETLPARKNQSQNDQKEKKQQMNKYRLQFSSILVSFGTVFRTNGIFLSPIIGFPIIYQLWLNFRLRQVRKTFNSLIKGILALSVMLAPFFMYQYYIYEKLCQSQTDIQSNNLLKQQCSEAFPNLYGFVQKKFWSVGFLSYFKPSNAIFILLGSPALIIGSDIFAMIWKELLRINRQCGLKYLTGFGVYFSFFMLYLLTATLTNTQSSTRFFSSHPIFYLILLKRWTSRLTKVWLSLYFSFGAILFCIGFPWT